jgi:hypothetical protein
MDPQMIARIAQMLAQQQQGGMPPAGAIQPPQAPQPPGPPGMMPGQMPPGMMMQRPPGM